MLRGGAGDVEDEEDVDEGGDALGDDGAPELERADLGLHGQHRVHRRGRHRRSPGLCARRENVLYKVCNRKNYLLVLK